MCCIQILHIQPHSVHYQEQVEEMKKREDRIEKKMADLIAENKRLTEPLQKAREEVEDLRRQMATYDKDKGTLRVGSHCGL